MTDSNSSKHREDDLTWLARNVHEWPTSDNFTIQLFCNLHGNTTLSSKSPNGASHTLIGEVTKVEWLARRAKLQNKPSWDDVESDAEWMAQSSNGRWELFNREPFASFGDGGGWKFDGFYAWISQNVGEVLGDWRATLERRPQAAKPEPSSSDWHKRGELPPVGMRVRLLFKGDYAYDCEIVAARGEYVVLWCADAFMSEAIRLEDCRFEPIQTERERVASELVDVMMAVPVSDRKTASESFMSMALAIYDHLHQESRV